MASAGQDGESPGAAADGGRGQRVRHGIEAAKGKYAGSSAEHLWRRLDAMDFINRGMLFAATLLLCLFPFLIVANALAGRSVTSGLARRLGLNQQAAADVGALFTSSAATSSAVTGTAWVFFILGGIAAATAIQGLYEAAFELEGRGARDMPRRLIWLAVLVGCSVLAGWAGPGLRGAGGPVLLAVTRPGGAHRVLVVHDLVPAGGADLLAGPVPGRRGHRRVLGGHGGGLLGHLLRHGDLV